MAQPLPEPTSATPAQPKIDPKARALELFKQSKDKYRSGDFQAAANLLEEAYELHDEPVLLYNLARAYEGLGELERAAAAYEQYLVAEPDTKDRGAIEQKVSNIRKQVAERDALAEQARSAADPAQPTRTEPAGVSPWPWVLVGVGAAGVGTGAILGVMANDKHDDAVAEPSALAAQDLQSSAEALVVAANLAFIAGGLVAAAGLAWGITDLSKPSAAEVVLTPNGVMLRGRF